MPSPAPVENLYVYYRVSASGQAAARDAAERFLSLLRAAGVPPPRVLRRPEADAAGRQTWMEIFEPWQAAWQPAVERAFRDSGMAALIEGDRHLELFVALDEAGGPA